MKKILMLGSGSYLSTLNIRLRDLARHVAADFEVSMVTPAADKYNNFTPDHSLRPFEFKLIQPWQLATKLPLLNLAPYLFSSLVTILKSRADIIYIYKPTPITVLGLIPRLWGRQVVLDLDDLGSEVMRLERQSRLSVALVAMCERLCMHFASKIVVTSTLLESIVRQKYPHKPILLLPNGVEPDDYVPVAHLPLRHAIYFFGGINRLNLIEDLLAALPAVLQAVPDTKVTIAGGGSALEQAKQRVRSLGVEESVKFTGWLSDMHAVQAYTQFGDIGVCYQPDGRTMRAASNMKVFQYMAMRTVPVVSNVGDLRRYVLNGKAGVVVPPSDVAALSEALVELLVDTKRRTVLTERAYRLASTRYSWRQRAKDLRRFIEEV